METPKHLTAIAASKNTAARGNVSCETAKKDEARCGVARAQSESRYNPNAATEPESTHVTMPGMSPADARACVRVVRDTFTKHGGDVVPEGT
jgi:hypothetical protein